jgi:hypothetical protein
MENTPFYSLMESQDTNAINPTPILNSHPQQETPNEKRLAKKHALILCRIQQGSPFVDADVIPRNSLALSILSLLPHSPCNTHPE